MRRGRSTALGLMILMVVGCHQGTSTAPSTDPNRPGAERRLAVTIASHQTVVQDRTDEILVTAVRQNASGPVDVELRSLPSGVEVVTKDMTIPADKATVTVTIMASPTATPVEGHVVTVAAKARDQKDLPEATATFKLDVKAK
jgi:hypothetical protein